MGLRIDIGEYRSNFLPMQGVRSRNECVGRDDDFTLQLQRANRDLQRNGAVTHGHAMPDAEIGSNLLLELLQQRPVV